MPGNCRTAVDCNKGWKNQRINAVYSELAEQYGTAIIPDRVRLPKEKLNAKGSVGNISTWITTVLSNERVLDMIRINCQFAVIAYDNGHNLASKFVNQLESFPAKSIPIF